MCSISTFLTIWIFLVIFEYVVSMNTFSHLDEINDEKVNPDLAYKDIEQIYMDNLKMKDEKYNDPVCTMTDWKKRSLCDLVTEIEYYKNMGYYTSKVAHYVINRLPCNPKLINFLYLDNKDEITPVIQSMYPCYGRHKITRTSIVEDEYYGIYYLSAGPVANSVTVYFRGKLDETKTSFYVSNYIYNVQMSELNDTVITMRQVNEELKMMKTIYNTRLTQQAEILYGMEYQAVQMYGNNYWEKNDLICELEYERKISLCNIIRNYYHSMGIIHLELNKAATYIFSMSCVKKTIVYENRGDTSEKLMKVKQKMYHCYLRNEKHDPWNSLMYRKISSGFYVSSNRRRNSIFVYGEENDEMSGEGKVMVIDQFVNIDLRHLKPTIITISDLIAESKSSYSKVQQLINEMENKLEKELSTITTSYETEDEENEIIQQILKDNYDEIKLAIDMSTQAQTNIIPVSKAVEISYETNFKEKSIQKSTELYKIKDQKLKSNTSKSEINKLLLFDEDNRDSFHKSTDPKIQIVDTFLIGEQVYKRLLQKKRKENTAITASLGQKSLESAGSVTDKKFIQKQEKFTDRKKIKKEVKKLIENMENTVFLMIEQYLGSGKDDKQLKLKSKRKKPKE